MPDYKVLQILLPIYYIATLSPVFRFHTNKYLYYLFIIAIIDPIYLIITYFTPIKMFNYLPLFIMILFISLPVRIIKQKVLVFVVILILLPRLGQFPLLELMICQIMFFYIIYFLVDDLMSEIKLKGTLSIFLTLLIIYLMYDAFRVYIYYENINLFISMYTFALIVQILIPILITIVGPDTKIRMINKEAFISLNQGRETLTVVDGNYNTDNFNDLIELLTPTEKRVLIEIGKGTKNKEIASLLGLNLRTIYFHLHKIKSKLSFNNNNQIVKFAVDNRAKLSSFKNESDLT